MDKKRGISLVAILIAITITIAMSTIVIVNYRKVVVKAQVRDVASDFYAMKQLVNDYYFINSEYPLLNVTILVQIPEGAESQFQNEPLKNGKVELKYIDNNKLNLDGLVRGALKNGSEDRYAMSEWTKRIYYLKGVTIENTTYYTLTDSLYKVLDISNIE